MTTNYMWRVVKRVAYQAGVRPIACTCGTTRQDRHARGCPRTSSGENRSAVSPHTLRRTFGSDLINRGLRLETVSKLLGHSNTTITERAYAQLLAPTIRRELFEAFAHTPRPIGRGEEFHAARGLRPPGAQREWAANGTRLPRPCVGSKAVHGGLATEQIGAYLTARKNRVGCPRSQTRARGRAVRIGSVIRSNDWSRTAPQTPLASPSSSAAWRHSGSLHEAESRERAPRSKARARPSIWQPGARSGVAPLSAGAQCTGQHPSPAAGVSVGGWDARSVRTPARRRRRS